MSRSAKVRLGWGDGEYDFRLAIAQLDEFDDLCKVGPGHALGLIQAGVYGNWKPRMVREAIRLGLIGGGTDVHQAQRLVKRYVDARPLAENLITAQAVLLAAVVGCDEEPVPEPSGEGLNRSHSLTGASGSDGSTKLEPSSGSAAPTCATAASGSSPTPSTAGAKRTRPRKP